MKKILFIGMFLAVFLFSANAQGLYFDIGIGFGGAVTEIDGTDVSSEFSGSGVSEIAADLGLKAGYGPIGDMNFYIIGALGGIGHRFYNNDDYLQFNSYIIGPGVIFYPIPLIQLAGSFGFSFVSNASSLPVSFYGSERGIAWDLSAALDFGQGNHGFLLGLRYFGSNNTLEVSGADQTTSYFGVFIRYAFRQKII